MPLTAKGRKVMAALRSEYGDEKKSKSIFYAMKNKGKLQGVDLQSTLSKDPNWIAPKLKGLDRRRFFDALRSGLSVDAAFGVAMAEEAAETGQGRPLDKRLLHDCVVDAAGPGGAPHEVLHRAMRDRRINFQGGTTDDLFEATKTGVKRQLLGDGARR